MDHPKTVYLREAEVLGPVDGWLASKFAPAYLDLDETLAELADQAEAGADTNSALAKAAQTRIADCDRKIAQYRASLDAGGDPAVVGPWIAEIQAKRVVAQVELRKMGGQTRMTRETIASLVTALGDLTQVVRNADPADKAEIYAQLGPTLIYRPQKRLVEATVRPSLHMCKGLVSEGGLEHEKWCDSPGSGKSCSKSNRSGANAPGYSAKCSLFALPPGLRIAGAAGAGHLLPRR